MNGDSQYDAYIGNEAIIINPNNPFIPSSNEGDKDDLPEGAIIAIVGGVSVILLLILIGFVLCKKKKLREENPQPEDLLI